VATEEGNYVICSVDSDPFEVSLHSDDSTYNFMQFCEYRESIDYDVLELLMKESDGISEVIYVITHELPTSFIRLAKWYQHNNQEIII
jgi:hypothetical protein